MGKPLLLTFTLLLACCFTVGLRAQQNKEIHITRYPGRDSVEVLKDSVRQVDLYDVLKGWMGKKQPKTQPKPVITSKPNFSIIPAIGYTLTSGFAVSLSGNAIFKLDSLSKVSTVTASATISSRKQLLIPVQSTIWLRNGKYVLIGDYRFYKYPQSTYGLGSNSPAENQNPMNFNLIRFYETIMRQITGNFYLGLGYTIDYHANISEQGLTTGVPTDYARYGQASHTVSSGLSFNALYDSRDNSINASHGGYASMQFKDNYKFLGSNSGWRSLILDVRKYFRLPANSENVLAFWSYDWVVISGKPPYLDLPANGWDAYSTTSRGYIQGRFRGAQMLYFESEYRFRITRNGLLGGVLFANAQAFSAAPGTNVQSIQPAIGPGLRLKLNKVSRTNICLDYGFGAHGSNGLFVNVGEVF